MKRLVDRLPRGHARELVVESYDVPVRRPEVPAFPGVIVTGKAQCWGAGGKTTWRIPLEVEMRTGTLVIGNRKYPMTEARSFSAQVDLDPNQSEIVVSWVGDLGEILQERWTLECPTSPIAVTPEGAIVQESGWKPSASIGFTYLKLTETQVRDFSQFASTAKLGVSRRWVGSPWEVAFSGYLTLLPISESYSAQARFYGFNARAGYRVRLGDGRWNLNLMGGLYALSMTVKNNQFGFAGMSGPQLYPFLAFAETGAIQWGTYVKFSPVKNAELPLTFQTREIAWGLSRFQASTEGSRWKPTVYSLDIADLRVVFPRQTLNIRTYSLSAGIRF